MSNPSFIMVSKVIKDGNGVKESAETIRLDLIRSVRKWNKTAEEKSYIKGDITVLYMIPDGSEGKPRRPRVGEENKDSMVKISESLDSFNARIGAIKKYEDTEVKRLGNNE